MSKILIEKMRRVYTTRLIESLSETDVVDKEGNVLISKDLKVIHKDSGYEYTVDDIVKGGDGIKIVLRKPEEPRFDPAPATTLLDELDQLDLQKYLNSDDISIDANLLADETNGDVFVVDEESFEKEYEVK